MGRDEGNKGRDLDDDEADARRGGDKGGSLMKHRATRKRAQIGVTFVLMMAWASTALADPVPATSILSLSASASGGNVAVTGAAVFAGDESLIEEDFRGDATVSGMGADLLKAWLQYSFDSQGGRVRLTLEVADPPADDPPAVHYTWRLQLVGPNGQLEPTVYHVSAVRNGMLANPGVIGPAFRLETCQNIGGPGIAGSNVCTHVAELSGSMQEGQVVVDLPLGLLTAGPGSVISWQRVTSAVNVTAGSSSRCCVYLDVSDVINPWYVVPTPSVRIGIGSPGTAISPNVQAVVNPDGTFSGILTNSTAESVVLARACFPPGGACAESQVAVT